MSHRSGSSYVRSRGASSPSSHSRSHSQFSASHRDDDYYEGDSTVEYEGDSVAQVEENIQLDDEEEDDEDFYSEAGPTTARTRSPTRSTAYSHSRSPSRSGTQTYTRTNSPTRTYDSRSQTYDDADDRTFNDDRNDDDDARTNRTSRTYDDARTNPTYDDDARTNRTSRTYDDARTNPTYDDDARTNRTSRTYDDAQTHRSSRSYDDGQTQRTSRSYDDARTNPTYDDDGRTYDDDARTYDDDNRTYDDDGRTYDDAASEARTYEEGASVYDDGRSGYDDGSAAYDDGASAAYSATYDDGRSAAYSNSGGRSEAYSNRGGRSEAYSNSGGRSEAYSNSGGKSEAYSNSGGRSEGYSGARSEGYSGTRSEGYSATRSEGYSGTRSGAYDDGRSDAQSVGFDDAQSAAPAIPNPKLVLKSAQSYARSEGIEDARTQYSLEDDGASRIWLVQHSPEEILASLHAKTLDPINFERKVLDSREQTARSSSQLSRQSSFRLGPGSDISRHTGRSGSHARGSSDGGSLFSPSTHGSYLSPGGQNQPLSLFSPLLQPPKSETSALKEKEAAESLLRHPSASLGRRAGELIAFFESGATTSTGRPISPTKSDASFVSAASASGERAIPAGPRSSTSGSSSYGQGISSPGKSTSLSTFTRTFGSGSGSKSASGSGSYTGSGSDLGSTVSSPFARSRGTGVGLGFDALFSPSFPAARAGSPFRPLSPTKSASVASGSYVSGTQRDRDDAGSETYRTTGSARSETNRSDTYRSETNRSDTYRSDTNRSDTYRSETNASNTYRSGGSDTYRSGTGASESVTVRSAGSARSRSVASETYRSNTPTYTGAGSDTYRPGSVSGRSRSVASESYHSDAYMSGTGSDTYRAGGSDAGVSGFLSTMYPPASETGSRTVTGSRSGSHGRSESAFSQGRSDGSTHREGRNSYSRTFRGRLKRIPKQLQLIIKAQRRVGYVYPRLAYRVASSPSRPPKSPATPRATRTQRSETPVMPTTPKTPNPHHEDKFADWQERTPQPGDKTPYTNTMPLTPKTIGSSMTPRTQPGTMTPRTPGGRLGKALSEASTAPTSAEGLMRQRMSREIVNSVPVPSESEAIVLGHNGQDPIRINALWYLNVHAPPPFEWLRTQAVLYPNVLILTWIAPTGGRGVVTLDLVNCTESAELAETLCPFQLLYADGVERLGTDTARERVRWVGAIWEVLATIARTPVRAVTERSASPSESSLQRSSSVRSSSSEGVSCTSRAHAELASHGVDGRHGARADIDRALNRSSAGGAPVTVTSGASQGQSTLMSPPPGRRRSGAYTPTETSGLYTPSASATDRPRSSFYASSNVTAAMIRMCLPIPSSPPPWVRIEADTLSFRGSRSASMLGDSHDAFRRVTDRVAARAEFQRPRTRVVRDRTQSLSPAATDRRISFLLSMATALRLSVFPYRVRDPKSRSGLVRLRLDMNLRARDLKDRPPMVPSAMRYARRATCPNSRSTKQSPVVVVALLYFWHRSSRFSHERKRRVYHRGGFSRDRVPVRYRSVCPSTDFETVTVCPPSTEYEDARKCICPPSVEDVVEIVESPEQMTPVPVPVELTPPPSWRHYLLGGLRRSLLLERQALRHPSAH
ncbi:hypothetical protein RhiJN_12884 [Ceratobasidium sp. AG-Ba]|nr:hypothetical protein RhiJN_12884 [Ceratobasidium sp. AG-Ba]